MPGTLPPVLPMVVSTRKPEHSRLESSNGSGQNTKKLTDVLGPLQALHIMQFAYHDFFRMQIDRDLGSCALINMQYLLIFPFFRGEMAVYL